MAKYIVEILEEINKTPESVIKYKQNAALKIIFEYAFQEEKKFALPDGDPPFKPNDGPLGLTDSNLYQEVKRLYIFARTDISSSKREVVFVSMLESLHPSEAAIVIAIKDQTLDKLYPNITKEFAINNDFLPGVKTVKEKKVHTGPLPEVNAEKIVNKVRNPAPKKTAPKPPKPPKPKKQREIEDENGQSLFTKPRDPKKIPHQSVKEIMEENADLASKFVIPSLDELPSNVEVPNIYINEDD